MISRLTDTEPESWPTVAPETMIRHSVEDGADITDVTPVGWYGGTFYPEDGLLVITYQKHGNTFADQEDEDGETLPEHADTGLGLLTVERVVELVAQASKMSPGYMTDPRAWVLSHIERS
jgi:hypothetical protein